MTSTTDDKESSLRNLARISITALAIAVAPTALAQAPPRLDSYGILQVPFGGTGGGDVASARANLGATLGGVQLDAKFDLGLACDGVNDDSAKFLAQFNLLKDTTTPKTVVFSQPAGCLINPAVVGQIVVTGPLNLVGTNGGGIKYTPSSTISGYTFKWTANSGSVTVDNMFVDMNGAVAIVNPSGAFRFAGNANYIVTNNDIENAGSPTLSHTSEFLLEADGIQDIFVYRNIVRFLNPSIHSQRGIVVREFSGLARIISNSVYNTGISAWNATGPLQMIGNYATNSDEGSLFAFNPVGSSDTVNRNSIIAYNTGYLSGTVADENNDVPGGLEVGYDGVTVLGNTFTATGSECVRSFGWTHVEGNTCIGWGRANAGFTHNVAFSADNIRRHPNGPNFAYFNGNTAIDDGSVPDAHADYGFGDFNSTQDVVIGVNNFRGNQGAYNIQGGSTFAAAQKDNRIGNPCFAVDQANAGGTINSGFGPDRWTVNNNRSDTTFTVKRQTFAFTQCDTSLLVTVNATASPGVNDTVAVQQSIPIGDIRDFGFGTFTARDLVDSFCVRMSVAPYTGSRSVINLGGGGWSYVYEWTYSPHLAGGLQCFSHVIPGDLTNSLVSSTTTTPAMKWTFDLGSGTNQKTSTLNQWVSGIFVGSTTSQNFSELPNTTTLNISDARLLPAASDLGWTGTTIAAETQDAMRFYEKSFPTGTAPAQNAGITGAMFMPTQIANARPGQWVVFQRPMFTVPAVTIYDPNAADANCWDLQAGASVAASPTNPSTNGVTIKTDAAVATVGHQVGCQWTADSRL